MRARREGIRLFDPLKPEAGAAVFLALRWIMLLFVGRALLPMVSEVSAIMLFNGVLIMMTAATVGLHIRSSTLFVITLPIQVVTSGGFFSYCLKNIYIIDKGWSYGSFDSFSLRYPPFSDMLSLTHGAILLFVCFYDLYVSVLCIDLFQEEAEIEKSRRPPAYRRSPGAAIINVFYRRITSPSPGSFGFMETPRAGDDEESCIEATLFEHRAGRLV